MDFQRRKQSAGQDFATLEVQTYPLQNETLGLKDRGLSPNAKARPKPGFLVPAID